MTTQDIVTELTEKLSEVANEIKNKTGVKVLIGVGIEDGDIAWEGAVGTDNLDYESACRLLIGMNAYVADYYGSMED
jgi:hypothetical protein